jgi:hypothetical protein
MLKFDCRKIENRVAIQVKTAEKMAEKFRAVNEPKKTNFAMKVKKNEQ